MLRSRRSNSGAVIGEGKSDASGAYTVLLRNRIWIGRPVMLRLRHPDYQPLDLKEFVGDKLYVARMVPLPHDGKRRQSSPGHRCRTSWPDIRSRPPTPPMWAAR